MKKFSVSIIALLIALSTAFAQSPQAFKYQAVARDNAGAILASQNIGLQISILKGEITGSAVYSETHAKQTSSHGLINLEIGKGTVESGDFTTIDWGADEYFVKIEIDATGGASYSELGTSQLMSVPYALYAGNCFDFNYPDGFANQIPVTKDISNNKTYTVPSGKNLYIQFARNDLKIGNNTISQTYQNKMIVREGEVVTGLENSNNFFCGFLVNKLVTAVTFDLTSGNYTIPVGKSFVLLSCTEYPLIDGINLNPTGSSDGVEGPIIFNENQVLSGTGIINGYLKNK